MNDMIRLGKIKNLSWFEWRMITKALVMLPITALSLRLWGLVRTQEMLCSRQGYSSVLVARDQLQQALKIAHAVDVAAVHGLYKASCLRRSLVLCRFLRRRGIDCDLRIGADFLDAAIHLQAPAEGGWPMPASGFGDDLGTPHQVFEEATEACGARNALLHRKLPSTVGRRFVQGEALLKVCCDR